MLSHAVRFFLLVTGMVTCPGIILSGKLFGRNPDDHAIP